VLNATKRRRPPVAKNRFLGERRERRKKVKARGKRRRGTVPREKG